MNKIMPLLYHKPLWFVIHYITVNDIPIEELLKAWEQCKLIQKGD